MDAVIRASCRTQVTKLCNAAVDCLKTVTGAAPESINPPATVEEELNVFVQRLKNAHSNLKRADEAMRSFVKLEDMQKEIESVIEYDDKAITVLAELDYVLSTYFKPKKFSQPNNEISVQNEETSHNGIKLKAFEIKKFDGKLENWLPFWDQFKLAVHENRKLSTAAKFNFLSEALVGKAATTIAGFTSSEQCYNDAIALLPEEYGNSDKLVEKCLQKLMSIKLIQSSSDVHGLRQLYNQVTANMRSLTALQIPSSHYEVMVKSVLLKALPSVMRVQFHRSTGRASLSSTLLNASADNSHNSGSSDAQLKVLLDFIRVELEALEKSLLSERESNRNDDRERKGWHAKVGTATALFAGSSDKQQQCVFCKKGNHSTKNCKSNLSAEQRKVILRREGRCFRCTNKNHNSKFCKAQWIKCDLCSGRHLTSMCERPTKVEQSAMNDRSTAHDDKTSPSTATAATLNTLDDGVAEIFLQTAKAIISNENKSERILSRIIMDNGSQRTYVTGRVVKELNLPTYDTEKLRIIAFGNKNQKKRLTEFKRVELSLVSQYNDVQITIIATVVPSICDDALPTPTIEYEELNNLQLADVKSSNEKLITGINLLIGQDYYWKFNTSESELVADNLVAVNTFFGWTVQGQSKANKRAVCVFQVHEGDAQDFDVSQFWNLESIGIANIKVDGERVAIENTVANIMTCDGRYVVNLPWIIDCATLNNNKQLALRRLHALTYKLRKNYEKLSEYDNAVRDLINNIIAEKVTEPAVGHPIYYMPHRAVYREDKTTTKMRIVFDASSSEPGFTSLNEHLSAGENLVADLVTTILRFRSNKIALIADIEKAFLQISLADCDRDSHRFLWYRTMPNSENELPEIVEFRMTRVTFGVASSPFLLAATIGKHLDFSEKQYGPICDKLKRSFYVDDLVLSEETLERALATYNQSSKIMGEAKFNLRKWNTNDVELRKYFRGVGLNPDSDQKVLGINWCTISDDINVDISGVIDYLQALRGTKRNIMKAMAKIYDPLGILGPFMLTIKLILQNVWKMNVEWDQALSGELSSDFQCWQDDLQFLRNFTVQRCLSLPNSKCELHIFADALPRAYGAVAYVRRISASGAISTNLICSKNRVSPIDKGSSQNELTLPKLELTAALIAARLSQFLIKSLDFEVASVNLWTDSAITLNWIVGHGKKIKNYVAARVSEINKLSNIYDWRHCHGKSNPADLLTRGVRAKVLAQSSVWKYGPSWLSEDSLGWPSKFVIENSTNLMSCITETISSPARQPILPIDGYSKLKRLLRTTAFIFRFLRNSKKRSADRRIKSINEVDELTSDELQSAELYWIKTTQLKFYNEEIQSLSKGSTLPHDSKIVSLNPKLEDGVLRLTGRLPPEEFGKDIYMPIILPKQCHFSQLIVLEAHKTMFHAGVNAVLAQIRKKYWIVQGRQLIKTVLRHCVICKRLHGKSAYEPWTVLPTERVTTTRPFETTGVDFAGPLFVKSDSEAQQKKVYIMLFTCAAIRAVHLELVGDMSVKSCIDALRRFIARRGVPATIVSDNAKTFKRADLELTKLNELMKANEMQQITAHQGIKWKFIPERAAWWVVFGSVLSET